MRGRYAASLVLLVLVSGCTDAKSGGAPASPRAATTDAGRPPAARATIGALDEPGKVQTGWWTWAAGIPSGRNPVEDATGAHCAEGQPGDVWFLAGTFGGRAERACTVPGGVPVVAPIVNLTGPKRDCAAFMETANGTLTVDGKQNHVRRWQAAPVTVVSVAGNPVTRNAGVVETHGCGLWSIIKALQPGTHKVAIRGSAGDFKVAVDYTLTVTG